MERISQVAISLLLITASGCATLKSAPIYPTRQVIRQSYDAVWNATIAALEDHPIIAIEKESGFIATDWVTTTSTGAVAGGLGMMPGGRAKIRYKLNVHVTHDPDMGANVQITNHSEAWVYNVWSSASEWQLIPSETVIEHELLEKILEKIAGLTL